MINSLTSWKKYVVDNWQQLTLEIEDLNFDAPYLRLSAIVLKPIVPLNLQQTKTIVEMLTTEDFAAPFVNMLHKQIQTKEFMPLTVTDFIKNLPSNQLSDVLSNDIIVGSLSKEILFDLIITYLRQKTSQIEAKSHLHIQTKEITSEHDVIIAGRDVYTNGTNLQNALRAYLSELRAQWNHLDFNNIVSDPLQHIQTYLHQLYTPLDVWNISPLNKSQSEELSRLRQRAVEQDLANFRCSTVKVANDTKYLVITGSPGTGKSTVCGYLTIGLAYACDHTSEEQDGIDGLELLGKDWKNGALLPFYIQLRQFANDKQHFPRTLRDANYNNLLGYIKAQLPNIASDIPLYFSKSQKTGKDDINGTILILDGLDEIYDLKERRKAKKIIENFADTFPNCRVLVTCRTAAYRNNTTWSLSDRFDVVELAPYTWEQVSQYIRNWYYSAADNRPLSLGGKEIAHKQAKKFTLGLIETLKTNDHLWSLARQPLLLTLMVLIHEKNRNLPQNRAELYEKTVTLLHKWNPTDEYDPLAYKTQNLNYQRIREVLQIIAFNIQRDYVHYKNNDAGIERPQLISQLLTDEGVDDLLGAAIDDVLEYLATRNGILVADSQNSYRFLHLSIREYLAACALIEQYDEIIMPKNMLPTEGFWTFPANIQALLSKNPYRWLEVALFCGAILANDLGQDRLWNYLETLLPDIKPEDNRIGEKYNEGDIYRIAIAAEVWSDNDMRLRLRSHYMIQDDLRQAISIILMDDRLDVPEHTKIAKILQQISS